jgi:hypothetical protein
MKPALVVVLTLLAVAALAVSYLAGKRDGRTAAERRQLADTGLGPHSADRLREAVALLEHLEGPDSAIAGDVLSAATQQMVSDLLTRHRKGVAP